MSTFTCCSHLEQDGYQVSNNEYDPAFLLILSTSPYRGTTYVRVLFGTRMENVSRRSGGGMFRILVVLIVNGASPTRHLSVHHSLQGSIPTPNLRGQLQSPHRIPPPVPEGEYNSTNQRQCTVVCKV